MAPQQRFRLVGVGWSKFRETGQVMAHPFFSSRYPFFEKIFSSVTSILATRNLRRSRRDLGAACHLDQAQVQAVRICVDAGV